MLEDKVGMMEVDEKACPYCGETIKTVAIKCKHCNEMLGEKPAPPAPVIQAVSDNSRSTMSPAAYQLSVLCAGLLMVAGVGMFALAMTMDVSVAVPGGEIIGLDRVVNIHLLSQQQNYRNGGAAMAIVGLLLMIFANSQRPVQTVPSSAASSTSVDWQSKMSPQAQQMLIVVVGAAIVLCLLWVYWSMKG